MAQLPQLTIIDRNIIIPGLIKYLKQFDEQRPVFAPRIVDWFNVYKNSGPLTGMKNNISEAKLRKLINHIRINGLAPIGSGPNGYWTIRDPEKIREMADSMESRANSIMAAASGLRDMATDIQHEIDMTKCDLDFLFR